MSKRIAVVALVALVALAGCGGGPAAPDGPTGNQTTTVGTTTDGTETTDGTTTTDGTETTDGTTTTTADDSEAESSALPAVAEQSWGENGSVAFDRLFERHRAALANSSSYTFAQRIDSNTGRVTDTRIAVDHEAERANLSISVRQDDAVQIQETFVSEGVVYAKSGNETDVQYGSADQNLTGESFDRFVDQQTAIKVRGGILPALNYEHLGTENGAYVFEAESISASNETSFDAENVTHVSSRLAVAPEGYVRDLSLSLTVDTADGERTATATVSTTAVNETTVSEPAWTDEAAS